jgi:intracellular septation protein
MQALFDVFPVIVFFVVYRFSGIYAATAAIMATMALQVAYQRFRHGKVNQMFLASTIVVGILGAITLALRNPIFIQFISHKVARLLCPYALAILFISNLFLLQGAYLVFMMMQLAWYGLAIAGYAVWNERSTAIAKSPEKQNAASHS